jgi:hypothetical protein
MEPAKFGFTELASVGTQPVTTTWMAKRNKQDRVRRIQLR